MKVIIIAHESAPDDSSVEIHRFKFLLDDGKVSPLAETISLRTARVIVENLADGNAFIKMLQAIVKARPDEYDGLIGQIFPDHYETFSADEYSRPQSDEKSPGV